MKESASLESWSGAIDLRALRRRFPAPTYVLDERRLRDNLNAWAGVVGDAGNVCYPVKANPSPVVLELLAGWGARAECASGAEIRLARLAGFPSDKILYGTPAPDLVAACELFAQGGTVIADSIEFLRKLDEHLPCGPRSERGRVLLRVNPSKPIAYQDKKDWQDLTAHAEQTGKFGVPAEEVVEALSLCRRIRVSGLHTHVGTQMDHVEPYVATMSRLTELAEDIGRRTRHRVEILDLGGGLGIPFTPHDRFPSIEALGRAIRPGFAHGTSYWVEPGHALIGDAVGLLAGIVAKKCVRGRRWAIADVGTDQLAKITLLKWWHQVRGPNGAPLPMEGDGSLGGPLCFSGDILLPHTDVSSLEVGDPIFIQHTGAYCAALGNGFNGRSYGGMALRRCDGEIVAAANAEKEVTQAPLSTHVWGASKKDWKAPESIDLARVDRLSSAALRTGMKDDRYEFSSAARLSESSFAFEVDVDSGIPFVTMPLLVRIAGDASIIAGLIALAQDEKRFPIWGCNLRLDMPENLPCQAKLCLRIDLSAVANRRNECEKRVMARFAVDGTKVSGAFDLKFEMAPADLAEEAEGAAMPEAAEA
ncbi:pyridoxal-dependent decarboxylase, pyridoxal binding domain protein [Luteimonas gilva]|uniref:Pyridoxal-dependent decarboxylase, pyridoxal binding domain protein n=1 Tax=Luteimonas gilva TaxID=2572684 RepID=A0A4U5JVV4_9GAMM|nr:pyridoxal-dependent decarboxylase, pyridoxal binding domain protein [Luteimonas gilva]TKR33745.1 pyridoxal-dependent decarboxylase, pyridoxal binding domain protein [Luteimonas gilva]